MIVKQEKTKFNLDYFYNLLVHYACSSLDWINLAHRIGADYEDIMFILSDFIYDRDKIDNNKNLSIVEQDLLLDKILTKYAFELQKTY